MRLCDMVGADGVLLHLKASSMDSALEQIAARLGEMKNIPAPLLYAALHERVQAGVGMGHGVAIPHARMPQLRAVTALFARPIDPIPAPDGGEPIALIFVLLAPEGAHGKHLRALAAIAGVLRDAVSREQLLHARHPDAVLAVLEGAFAE